MATRWINTEEVSDLPNDKFCLMEINEDDVVVSPTMNYQEITQFSKNRYASLTLESFNAERNLYIINITRKSIRPLSIKIEI